ncbi:MAG: hypothetical protein H7331_08880, partial [Bacteroidia bacterium]|nr:hypothetical protein [Bacteroidia bacterium]
MKNISKALIATVLVCCLSFFQKKDNDEIVWSATYKLKWTDFKGKPDYNDTYKA